MTFVEPERPVRDWLRAESLDVIGERVYLGIPPKATYPLINVALVDGGVQSGDTPLAVPLFQFDVWGDGPNANRAELQGIAWALVALLFDTRSAQAAGAHLSVGDITGPTPRYDPDGTPRYLIEAAIAMKVLA